jgi:hypothetical protein
MGSLAGLVGLDAADRLGSGTPDDPSVLARQVDGDGVGGDVDGDDLVGVDAAQGDLLPGDHDDAGVAGPPLGGDRLCRWPWRWPGRAGALQRPSLIRCASSGAVSGPKFIVPRHRRLT